MVDLHSFLMAFCGGSGGSGSRMTEEDGTVEAWTSTCLQLQGYTGPAETSRQSMTGVRWLGRQELEGWRVRVFRGKTGRVTQAASSCKRQKPQPNMGHTDGNQPFRRSQ